MIVNLVNRFVRVQSLGVKALLLNIKHVPYRDNKKCKKNYLQRKAVENRSLKAIMEEKLKKQVIATQGPRHKSSILSLQERIGNACRT